MCTPHGNTGKIRPDLSERNFKHGGSGTKFYRIWKAMKNRCTNPNSLKYPIYGGRGITLDARWGSFIGFKEDMYLKFLYAKKQQYRTDDLSIERRDVNGNYCKENCTFIPMKNQWMNKQKKLDWFKITYPSGKVVYKQNLFQFAKENGLKFQYCYRCGRGERKSHNGFKFERVVNF
jgi:hypothetical protein